METKDIKSILMKFLCGGIESDTILIDGKWGCGKTTLIKDTLEELKETKPLAALSVSYVSLFGLQNVSQLGPCFSKFKRNVKKIGKITGSTLAFIPVAGNGISKLSLDALDLLEPNDKIKKGHTFIFDDLERIDDSFPIMSLLGLFNNIRIRGSRVLCISSLDELKGQKHDDIKKFAEKAFDRIIHINKTPVELIESQFKEFGFDTIGDLVNCFDDNIRTAKRVARLYRHIEEDFTNEHSNIFDAYSKKDLLVSCIYVIRVVYIVNSKKEEKQDNDLSSIIYDVPYEIPDYIANNWKEEYKVAKEDYFKGESSPSLNKLARAILMYELFDEKEWLSGLCTKVVSKDSPEESNILNKNFYLLNDSDKNKYFDTLKDLINDQQSKATKEIADRLCGIYQSYDYLLDDKTTDNFVTKTAKEIIDDKDRKFLNYIENIAMFSEGPYKDRVETLINKVKEEYKNLLADVYIKRLEEFKNKNDYYSLSKVLSEIKMDTYANENDKIVDYVVDNKFFLPDLSKSLDEEEWHMAHEMAKYSQKHSKQKEFVSLIKEIIEDNKDNKSAIDKATALVQYNLPKEYSDSLTNDAIDRK